MPETADKIRRAGRKDSSLARTRPGSPKQTQAEHPKDTVATPRHFGQHAPKPREGRFRSSATCADAAQNTPRHRARQASKSAKHAPRVFASMHRSATALLPDPSGHIVPSRSRSGDRYRGPGKGIGFSRPRSFVRCRDPRCAVPDNRCAPIHDTACQNAISPRRPAEMPQPRTGLQRLARMS